MKIRKSAAALAGATMLAGALALSGCASPTPAETTTPAETPTAVEPATIRVALAPIHFEAVHIGIQEGFFDDENLTVEIVPSSDATTGVAQVVSGEADFVATSWVATATATAQGVPLQIVAGNGYVDPTSDAFGVMVAADSPIQSVSDLAGKNVATIGPKSGPDQPLLLAAEAAGIDPDSIIQVAVPYPGMQQALEGGSVDAAIVPNPFYGQMKAAGFRSLGNFQTEFTGNLPITVFAATIDWLSQNADVAERFVAALTRSHEFHNDEANLDAVKAISAEVLGVTPDRVPPLTYMQATVNVPAITSNLKDLERLGYLTSPKSADEILWSGAPRTQ